MSIWFPIYFGGINKELERCVFVNWAKLFSGMLCCVFQAQLYWRRLRSTSRKWRFLARLCPKVAVTMSQLELWLGIKMLNMYKSWNNLYHDGKSMGFFCRCLGTWQLCTFKRLRSLSIMFVPMTTGGFGGKEARVRVRSQSERRVTPLWTDIVLLFFGIG